MSRVHFSHCYCLFKWRQAAGDHRHHRRQPSNKKPRARDTQPITDGSAQTNQLHMEVSGGPLALEPDEFTETNVLKEANRSCPTQDQCAGGLCAREAHASLTQMAGLLRSLAHSSLEGLPLLPLLLANTKIAFGALRSTPLLKSPVKATPSFMRK